MRKKYEDDVRINERGDLSVIDMKGLDQYVELIQDNNPRMAQIPKDDVLRFLNMIVAGRPTLICTILFSLYPQMFYPQYTVNAMVVAGYKRGDVTKEGARFIDNKRIEGTLQEILDETMRFLTKNMKVKTIIDPDTARRNDKTEYPLVAVREAVVNALIHRDYSIHTQAMPIEVIMYKDRLEICNPGGLYGRLTLDKLGKVQPDCRNPVLARAMETLGITENRYSGIPTIRRELKLAGMPEAEFLDSRNEFVVTFFNAEEKENLVDEVQQEVGTLFDFCRIPRSRQEIADYLKISTIYWVMKQHINPMIDEGKLQMTIPEHPKSKNQKYYTTDVK